MRSKLKFFAWGSNRAGQLNPKSSEPIIETPIELDYIIETVPYALFCGPY